MIGKRIVKPGDRVIPNEVYSRIVGYMRPMQQWHKGKAQEFKERKTFDFNKALERGDGERDRCPVVV